MLKPGVLKIFRWFLPRMTWEMDDKQSVFLTFDDGPTPGVTEWILDTLDMYGAKATFFCLGKNVEMYPELFGRIVESGHKVGNHTYSHQKGWETSTARYVEDVDFANQLICSDLFRPPYGRISRTQARILRERYRLVMGSIVSRDYSPLVTPRECLENVTEYVKGGSIVVFHDSPKSFRNVRYALPRTLEYLHERGLSSKPIEF